MKPGKARKTNSRGQNGHAGNPDWGPILSIDDFPDIPDPNGWEPLPTRSGQTGGEPEENNEITMIKQ